MIKMTLTVIGAFHAVLFVLAQFNIGHYRFYYGPESVPVSICSVKARAYQPRLTLQLDEPGVSTTSLCDRACNSATNQFG
jgi:hypothetical protein